ncbi:MAG: hypothetical protein QX198_07880 [Methylococcaceae bacterium]
MTLYYLRHYPTLINLAAVFGTCALWVSANRIATRYIHARQGCWQALKNRRTAKPCWKIQPPP